MEAGPIDGLTASITVPAEATDRAQSPIFSVIDKVVLGLMTLINISGIVLPLAVGEGDLQPRTAVSLTSG